MKVNFSLVTLLGKRASWQLNEKSVVFTVRGKLLTRWGIFFFKCSNTCLVHRKIFQDKLVQPIYFLNPVYSDCLGSAKLDGSE